MKEQSSKIAIKYYTLANLLSDNELTYWYKQVIDKSKGKLDSKILTDLLGRFSYQFIRNISNNKIRRVNNNHE